MAHWADGGLLLFDTETDSPQPEEAHLVTAALIHVRPGAPPVRHSWIAKPTRPIPEEAAKIHGFSTERAELEGDDPARVIEQIISAINNEWSENCVLVAYNANFDLTVMDRNLERHHGGALQIAGPVIDPLLIDRRADKWRPGRRKLEVTCAHYGIALTDAHEAHADALAAGRLAWTLGTRHRKPPPCWPTGRYGQSSPEEVQARSVLARGDAHELHRAQIAWYRISSLDLAAYFRTPKAVEKIWADFNAGETTREEAEELISTLPQRADDVERHADGWPLRTRVHTLTST